MTLLNPIWLWGLAGISIPVAIHLLSRKEGKTIKIGSIRFLEETTTSRFSSIRLNEIALLLVRILLLVCIILFLTGLLLRNESVKVTERWLLIERGLENNPAVKSLIDSLRSNQYQTRWLAPEFPLIDEQITLPQSDYYDLVEVLSKKENVESIVLAYNRLQGFKGKRIVLPGNIRWVSYPADPTEFTAWAMQNKDEILIRKGFSSAHELEFITEKVAPINVSDSQLKRPISLSINIVSDVGFKDDKKIFSAALYAIALSPWIDLAVTNTDVPKFNSTSTTDWVIWLSDSAFHYSGNSIRYRKNFATTLLLQENKNTWILTDHLDEERALKESLALQLEQIFFSDSIPYRMMESYNNRILSDSMAWSQQTGILESSVISTKKRIDSLLVIIIVVLLIAERSLAFYRKQ